MDNERIERVTFLKAINHSTQIFEKNITPNSVMSISLPRVKFLEVDGEYRPSWAISREKKPFSAEKITPAQQQMIRKERIRTYMYENGEYEISEFEQLVYDMMKAGKTKEQICIELNKKPSAVGGAIGRYEKKMLAKNKKA